MTKTFSPIACIFHLKHRWFKKIKCFVGVTDRTPLIVSSYHNQNMNANCKWSICAHRLCCLLKHLNSVESISEIESVTGAKSTNINHIWENILRKEYVDVMFKEWHVHVPAIPSHDDKMAALVTAYCSSSSHGHVLFYSVFVFFVLISGKTLFQNWFS